MMRLNRKVEYALIALKYMNSKKPGQLSTAKEVSERYGAPFDATSRVLQVMAQNGILKSEQGAQGGYLIMKDLSKISFLQLNEMILGPVGVAKCINRSNENDCELVPTCNILSPVRILNSKMNEFFRSLSIAEVLGSRDTEHQEMTTVGGVNVHQ